MKSYFITDLVLKDIDGVWVEVSQPFKYYSRTLQCKIIIPVGFISDAESVPILKSTSKRAGVIHDYLSRIDAYPCITKSLAARVYLEAMTVRDKLYFGKEPRYKRSWLWFYRHVKSSVVRWWPGYWKKYRVDASYDELSA